MKDDSNYQLGRPLGRITGTGDPTEPASGSRGIYTPAQVNKSLVEKELMKLIAEIANW